MALCFQFIFKMTFNDNILEKRSIKVYKKIQYTKTIYADNLKPEKYIVHLFMIL